MSKGKIFRDALKRGMVTAPGCYDCIGARAIERAGFEAAYMTGAGTAAMLGYLDYQRKVVGFGPLVWPSGDIDQDLGEMRRFYEQIGCRGKFPQLAAPVQPLPPERKT